MSEWLNFVKEYSLKNKIPYKQALKEASPSYKTRNDVKPEPKTEPQKTKRKYNKKVVENITLNLS
jgi:hypothetical protein